MQVQTLPKTDSAQLRSRSAERSWYVIRSTGSRKRKAAYRKWRGIHARSCTAMLLFAPLFFLVWLGVSMLQPQNHLFAGAVLLLILAAESVSVTAYLISDVMMRRFRCGR